MLLSAAVVVLHAERGVRKRIPPSSTKVELIWDPALNQELTGFPAKFEFLNSLFSWFLPSKCF